MKKINILSSCMMGVAVFGLTACSDVADEVTSLIFDRDLAPVGLEASNLTESSAKLDWVASEGAPTYMVEVYQDDSLSFEGSPVQTLTVSEDDIPYTITGLIYDTKYSARVMALDSADVSRNSKWSNVYFRTSAQQIFNNMKTEDVADKSVYLSWPAEETNVTTIRIYNGTTNALVTEYVITDADKAAGHATVTGLSPETDYVARLYYGEKERGNKKFTTIADLNGAITVRSSEDLKTILENAEKDAVIALYGGTYNIQTENEETGELENTAALIKNNVTIKGIYPTDLPTIKGRFQIEDGAALTVQQVILDGSENNSTDQCFNFKTAGVEYGALNVKNTEIKGYAKGVYYANVEATIDSITFDNCNIHDIVCDGGDLFDCRKAYIKALTFSNSTIWNCAQDRDFIRYDDNSSKFSGAAPVITVDHCTINNVCNNTANKRILYVRFAGHSITWSNNILSNTKAVYSNQSKTNAPTFTNNAYYGCPDNMFVIVEKTTTVADVEAKNGENPQYADAANGDFTIGNESVKKLKVGAERWYK